MLTIGDDTVIRRESSFTGYRAVAGVIQTGPVSIGKDALIGEHTLLDIGTRVGDGSQLGHTMPARIPGRPGRPALARIPRPAHRRGLPLRRSRPLRPAAPGYRLPDYEQTGSNFGADLEHETPFGIDIGRGTMIADGATLIDAGYSSTSFRVTPLSIGPRNFLGNAVAYPAGGRTGENCLIATKAMVPLDGPVRANTGLLGSPCFEIPRSVSTDPRFDHLRTGEEFRRRLRPRTGTTSAPYVMTRICRVPWARMDDVRAQHDVLSGNADLISPPPANRCFCAGSDREACGGCGAGCR